MSIDLSQETTQAPAAHSPEVATRIVYAAQSAFTEREPELVAA